MLYELTARNLYTYYKADIYAYVIVMQNINRELCRQLRRANNRIAQLANASRRVNDAGSRASCGLKETETSEMGCHGLVRAARKPEPPMSQMGQSLQGRAGLNDGPRPVYLKPGQKFRKTEVCESLASSSASRFHCRTRRVLSS